MGERKISFLNQNAYTSKPHMWPIYVLYSWELISFIVIGLNTFVISHTAEDQANVLNDLWFLLILQAPIIIGFWLRLYFIRGIWIAYAWVFLYIVVSANIENYESIRDPDLWSDFWIFTIHPIVVTFVLLVSHSAKEHFTKETEKTLPLQDTREQQPDLWTSGKKISPNAFLEMRLAKNQKFTDQGDTNHHHYSHAIWIGIVVFLWAQLLGEQALVKVGLGLTVMGFVMARVAMKGPSRFGRK